MFLKVIRRAPHHKEPYESLYEGRTIHTHWNHGKQKDLLFIVEQTSDFGVPHEPIEVLINDGVKVQIYIMSDKGKTIECIEYNPDRKG